LIAGRVVVVMPISTDDDDEKEGEPDENAAG